MKYIIIISLLFLTIRGIGQEIKVGQRFTFKTAAKLSETKDNNLKIHDTDNISLNYLESGIIYKIVNVVNDIITVMVDPPFKESRSKKKNKIVTVTIRGNDTTRTIEELKSKTRIEDEKSKNRENLFSKDLYYNYKLFNITKTEFLTKMEDASQYDLPDRINIGILTLPFKFRFTGTQSFESDFNINSTASVRTWSLGGGHLFLQMGAGIGGVELTDVNTKGIVDKSSIKANALSMMVGAMVQYKKIQAGIYLGVDYINNQTFYQWEYQGKPWLAFGVGYQLFNVGLGQDKTQKNQ